MGTRGVIGTTGVLTLAVAAAIMVPRLGSDGAGPGGGPDTAPPATGDPGGGVLTAASACDRWVSPGGDDRNAGGANAPWRSLQHAVEAVPDRGCTVWFEDGIYRGTSEIDRAFRERTVFRAVTDHRAVLQSQGTVLDIGDAASFMTFSGFRIRQSTGGSGVAVYVSGDRADEPAPHRITFANNILHDSFDEDLMKIRSRAHAITVRGNVFYNQGSNEQHMDVNSVWNVVIEDNVFFNAFGASDRASDGTTKHFIVVKDSNEGEDGLRGTSRVAIRRNVFLNWQGDKESFIGIGNDGKPYHEAKHVAIVNNLMIGNTAVDVASPLTVFGASDVTFVNNTVVGNLPSDAYGFEVDTKGRNPRNEAIRFRNNIWSDQTGTMAPFSDGRRTRTVGLVLDNNLYWNGGRTIPAGDLLSPRRHDARRVMRDPGLPTDHAAAILPVWDGSAFRSGAVTIREELVRLVEAYASIPAESPAVGRALRAPAPERDILGRLRDGDPDLGAFEVIP